MVRAEHVVRITDMSVVGVGIESRESIEPGLVCFEEPVSGHKFGIITWCKRHGGGYRAGINFVRIGHDHAKYILTQIMRTSGHQSLHDPEKIIETLLKSLKQENCQ